MNTLKSIGKPNGFPFFIAFFLAVSSNAQFYEFGAGIGGLNYTGDISKHYKFTDIRPGGQLFFRMNYSSVVSIRYSITAGNIAASDSRPYDPFAAQRNASFSIFALEAAAALEYHFLDFKHEKSLIKWSPYFFLGIGAFTFFGEEPSEESYIKYQPVIPFGVGIKHIITPRWHVGIEFGARKTFFDYIDNVSAGDQSQKNYQYGNKNSMDWYYYAGISVSYLIFKVPCPYI